MRSYKIEISNDREFDLIDYQDKLKSTFSLKDLYELYDSIYNYYDEGTIGKYEINELKEAFWKKMKSLKRLKRAVEGCFAA